MRPVLTIDFGSTYTKVVAVDADAPRILATAQDFTTAATDLSSGLDKALAKLHAKTGPMDYAAKLACSSAAGGLRMVAVGLVPALTAKAARFAAYGAGAKVIATYSYELTRADAEAIRAHRPDIVLLSGGTDGGNKEVILKNARMLAGIEADFPVIVAGNRAAQDECVDIIAASGKPVYGADNVMPSLNMLNVRPAQDIIRRVFLERIVLAKGLSTAQELIDGILMPTPAAVLNALTLLAEGTSNRPGLGDLMAVDVGGATTDVYSIARGLPTSPATMLHGLREPRVKRTVEGDIGMRYGASGVAEAAGMDALSEVSGLPADTITCLLRQIQEDPSLLPQGDELSALDYALAVLAVRTGLIRHAGTLTQVYTPMGAVYRQEGKDLTEISRMVVTGGTLIYSGRSQDIVKTALQGNDPSALLPRDPVITVDHQYILASMGLLAGYDQAAALDILLQQFGKDVDNAAGQ